MVIVLKELMELHSNVIFGGDGYSSEWHTMAVEERGLKNIPTTADALPAFLDQTVIDLFDSTGVLTPVELKSRYEVYAEQYVLSIEVESKLVVNMAKTMIFPAAVSYLSDLTDAIGGAAELSITLDSSVATAVGENINGMMAAVAKLETAMATHDFASTEEHMKFCADTVCGLMLEVRGFADTLETLVADDVWPLPKYSEMLFMR